jgi:hypothetical protein
VANHANFVIGVNIMRIVMFFGWCLLGTAIFLPGCSAGISATGLSARVEIKNPAAPVVTVVTQPSEPAVPSI